MAEYFDPFTKKTPMESESKNILQVKKLNPKAILPTRGHSGDAGLDLYTLNDKPIILKPHGFVKVPTGIAIKLPEGTTGLVQPRSSAFGRGLWVHGVIDSPYVGEVFLMITNLSDHDIAIEPFSRYAQMVIVKYENIVVAEVSELPTTERGDRGFGSSGLGVK